MFNYFSNRCTRDQKSIITQRELGTDTNTFSKALRAALRQDPDVILIGEMRDKDTIETGLMAAETGHLVISTLHTKDARETINRVLSYFPTDSHQHVRNLLAANLRAIVSLRLAKKKKGEGFIPAVEILINNARISEMIKNENETHNILEAIEENSVTDGMQSFDQHLIDLVKTDRISKQEAFRLTNNPQDLELRLKGLTPKGEKEWQDFHSQTDSDNPQETNTGHIWDDLPDLELDLDDTEKSSSHSNEEKDSGVSVRNSFGFRKKKS